MGALSCVVCGACRTSKRPDQTTPAARRNRMARSCGPTPSAASKRPAHLPSATPRLDRSHITIALLLVAAALYVRPAIT